jgi:hypothetical protein
MIVTLTLDHDGPDQSYQFKQEGNIWYVWHGDEFVCRIYSEELLAALKIKPDPAAALLDLLRLQDQGEA